MKRVGIGLLLSVVFLLAGCMTRPGTDYQKRENWMICENEKTTEREFDLFYIYPTLTNGEPSLMNWHDNPALVKKTVGFVTAQTGLFAKKAGIFAPYVRQLEYSRCLKILQTPGIEPYDTEMRSGIDDTVQAFRYYLKHYNGNRPYVLLGHSQGAMDLYELLRRCPEITPENGFVAAYLIGLPGVTAEKIAADFAGRPIRAAAGKDDVGVIAIWNTQNDEAVNPLFAGRGNYLINPLNWKTDETPASASENLGAVFYRDDKSQLQPNFCGARIDLAKGALIVDLPSDSRFDSRGFMGKGVFHMNDVWFFAVNLYENALIRTAALRSGSHRTDGEEDSGKQKQQE